MCRKMLFAVHFTDESCKKYAIKVLQAIEGIAVLNIEDIFAENDKKSEKLVRDVIVTVTESRDLQLPGKILAIFGSVHKKLVFQIMFENVERRNKALGVVKALKGVVQAECDPVLSNATEHDPNTPLTLNVAVEDGNPDPTGNPKTQIVLDILKEYAAPGVWALYG